MRSLPRPFALLSLGMAAALVACRGDKPPAASSPRASTPAAATPADAVGPAPEQNPLRRDGSAPPPPLTALPPIPAEASSAQSGAGHRWEEYYHPSWGPQLPLEEQERLLSTFRTSREGRTAGRRQLEDLAKAGFNMYPMVLAMIDDGDFTLRWEAVNFLGNQGDLVAVPILIEQVTTVHPQKEMDHHVRWRTIWALTTIHTRNRGSDIPSRLAEFLDHEDPARVFRACVALAQHRDPRVVGPLEDALTSEDDFQRLEAVLSLKHVQGPETFEKVARLLDDKMPIVRREAEKTLRLIQ